MRCLVVFLGLCSVVCGQTTEMDWKKVDAFQRDLWSSLGRDLTEAQKSAARKDFLDKWNGKYVVFGDVVQDVVPQGDGFLVVTSFGSLSIANPLAEASRIRKGDFLVRRGSLALSFRLVNNSKSIIGLVRPDASMDPAPEDVGRYFERRRMVLDDFRKKVGDFVYVREVWTRAVVRDSSTTGTQTEFVVVNILNPHFSIARLKDSGSRSDFFRETTPEERRADREEARGKMMVEHLREIEKMELEKRREQ